MEKHTCEYCQRLILVRRDGRIEIVHKWPIERREIMEAKEAGCPLFRIAALTLEEAWREDLIKGKRLREIPSHEWEVRGLAHLEPGEDFLKLFLDEKKDNMSGFLCLANFDIFVEPGTAASVDFQTRPPNCSPGSPKTMALVRDCVAQCLSSHQHEPLLGGGFKPSRLLRIQTRPCSYSVELVESPDIPDSAPYATLSYCWGGDQPHKLTKGRLAAKAPMSFEALPKTIRDAIVVTAQIGFQFLWVDSLCICQDDNEDVIREIASMPFIYTNSVVTIAAASAHAVSKGFLHNRSHAATFIPFRDLDSHSEGTLGLMEFDESPEHLDTRGWVLQETLLPTRLLEVGSRQISFHCRGSEHDMKWVDGWSPEPLRMPRRGKLQKLRENIPRSSDEAHKLWLSLVEDYVGRELTELTDRSLAIASAAQVLSTVSDLKGYVAGHWQSRLPMDLVFVVKDGWSKDSQTKYLGPSWSWVGKDAHIHFGLVQEPHLSSNIPVRKMAEVVSAVIYLVNDQAPFGAVKEGVLKLRGRFKTAFHFKQKDKRRWLCEDFGHPKFSIQVIFDSEDFHQDVGTTPFGLFEVVRFATNKLFDEQVLGLVLKEVASMGDVKRYVRVGIFTFRRVRDRWESPKEKCESRADGLWDTDMVSYLREFEERTIEVV